MEVPSKETIEKYCTYSMSQLRVEWYKLIDYKEDTEEIKTYFYFRRSNG